MNAVKIKAAVKEAGFLVLIETHSSMVIGKKGGPKTSIIIDACDEKKLAKILKGKAPRKGAAAKAAEKAPEVHSTPEEKGSEDKNTPIDPKGFLEQVEAINGIGPKTAQELYVAFTTIENLMIGVKNGESGLSAALDNKLLEEFS